MPHVEVIQNGVVIIKPDVRLKRALRIAQQFLGRVGGNIPGLRSLLRHELILRWLHRELQDFAVKQKYRGKAVYVTLDEKILAGVSDLASLVKNQAKYFLPIKQLEAGIRGAFSIIAKEKIHSEQRRKVKKQVQTYGEAWQHRASYGGKRR